MYFILKKASLFLVIMLIISTVSFAAVAAPIFEVGDVNHDTKINGKDALELKKHLGGRITKIDKLAADINGDGKINGKDSLHLRRFFTGQGVTLANSTTASSTSTIVSTTSTTYTDSTIVTESSTTTSTVTTATISSTLDIGEYEQRTYTYCCKYRNK